MVRTMIELHSYQTGSGQICSINESRMECELGVWRTMWFGLLLVINTMYNVFMGVLRQCLRQESCSFSSLYFPYIPCMAYNALYAYACLLEAGSLYV